MVSDPKRLAQIVSSRRMEVGLKTARSLATAAELSERIIGDVENGRRDSYARSTLIAIDQALGWRIGSAQAVLEGGDPVINLDAPIKDSQLPPGHDLRLAQLLLSAGIPDGFTELDLTEVESVAIAAALKRAREIEYEKSTKSDPASVEAVRHSVDTRSTTGSPTRTTT